MRRALAVLVALAAVSAISAAAAGTNGRGPVGPAGGARTVRRAELAAPDGAADDLAGRAVATDGAAAVVGAPFHSVAGRAGQGAAYVFMRAGSWTSPAELVSTDGARDDQFGSAVAVDGPVAIVGAPHHTVGSDRSQGAAYVFTHHGTTWIQTGELTAADGSVSDEFGATVSLSGPIAVIGAPYHAVGSTIEQGAAYVFRRIGATWTQVAELTAADGEEYDNFGIAVAVSGRTVVVGGDDHQVGRNEEQGAAYVFTERGSSWTQVAELTAADGEPEDFFGSSVAVSGDTVVVGAPDHTSGAHRPGGEADVFTMSGGIWTQTASLLATPARGARRTSFGCSVAAGPGLAVVGGEGHQVGGRPQQGLVYVFTGSGSAWTAAQPLIAADGRAYDNLGAAVALGGGLAIAGAPGHSVGGRPSQGAAYVFADLP